MEEDSIMKKYFISIFILLGVSVTASVSSCSKFDQMSKNPYALYEAPAESFVHPIMFKTEYNLISVFRSSTSLLMQYGVSTNSEVSSRVIDNYNIPEGTTDDVWSALYIQFGNAVSMYQQAVADKDEAMQGVALILKALVISQIADTYGDVPYKEAGILPLEKDLTHYSTKYDTQKDIYRDIICMLEDANELLAKAMEGGKVNFSAVCDKTFKGSYDKWRRFGNSLYARSLTRIALKVIEEDNGILQLNDKWEAISVKAQLAKLYHDFQSGSGDYPQMRDRSDRPMVPFSDQYEPEHTPFYTTTSGNWNTVAVSDVMTRNMLDYTVKVDSDGITYYEYKAGPYFYEGTGTGHVEDPRYDCWWRKATGMPVQLTNDARVRFLDSDEHKSKQGNSKIGRMTCGVDGNGNPSPSGITQIVFNLKNADTYPLMQYSELLFIYAEAGARNWVADASGVAAYLQLYQEGITQSILEWRNDLTATSPWTVDYVNFCSNGMVFSDGNTFNSDNALEAILTQKWVAQFFIGIESWCDYRRTGYPLLRTDGPAATNNHILPTRMRYPSDEVYRNTVAYPEALDRWLGGTNNIQTDVWWADTQISKDTRLLGRQ